MPLENKHWGENYAFAFSEILEGITEMCKKHVFNISIEFRNKEILLSFCPRMHTKLD